MVVLKSRRGWLEIGPLGLLAVGLLSLPAGALAPPGRYTAPGDGTVHDTETGLVWQQILADNSNGQSFSDAATYCSTLGISGTGWRVPNIRELLTLVDDTVSSPSIDTTFFPSMPTGFFWWSSSSVAGNASNAWYISFDDGYIGNSDMSFTNRVRCVR